MISQINILLIILFPSFCFGQSNEMNKILVDSNFTIIKYDTSDYCQSKLKKYSITTFDSNSIGLVDSLVNKILSERINDAFPFLCGIELHADPYNYQIVALKTMQGKDIIWVNAFGNSLLNNMNTSESKEKKRKRKKSIEEEKFDWKKNIVCGYDGCGVFWEFKIDLKNNTYFDLYISGI